MVILSSCTINLFFRLINFGFWILNANDCYNRNCKRSKWSMLVSGTELLFH
jgi:hypothetical protein